MSGTDIPNPPGPTTAAREIERRLLDGERVDYEEMEDAIDDRDFRDLIRPIAMDDGDGWVRREQEGAE